MVWWLRCGKPHFASAAALEANQSSGRPGDLRLGPGERRGPALAGGGQDAHGVPQLPHRGAEGAMNIPCLNTQLPAYLATYLPAYLPACLPAYLPTFIPACLSACLPACLPTCLPSYLPAYLPTCLPAYLPACLPACRLSFLPACPSACLPTYFLRLNIQEGTPPGLASFPLFLLG